MTEVYFAKEIEKILEKLDLSKLGNKVAIKLHFGEKGCVTYINPELVKKVYGKIKGLGKEVTLIECNVLYKGSRTNTTDHIRTAREHGFDMPIDILDGENGQEFIEIDGCKIGAGIKKYDSLVVLSHFKGHIAAGYGGAIKNLGMGLGSRAGKLDMHSTITPVIGDNCIGCGICVENCNANAISMKDDKAVIDPEKCEGCAMCIAVCNNGACQVPWHGGTSQRLQKKMAEYSKAALSLFDKVIFINVLENITSHCDCMGQPQQPMMPDVGILASENMFAVDKASLDLAAKGGFLEINQVDKYNQLASGDSDYELVELD